MAFQHVTCAICKESVSRRKSLALKKGGRACRRHLSRDTEDLFQGAPEKIIPESLQRPPEPYTLQTPQARDIACFLNGARERKIRACVFCGTVGLVAGSLQEQELFYRLALEYARKLQVAVGETDGRLTSGDVETIFAQQNRIVARLDVIQLPRDTKRWRSPAILTRMGVCFDIPTTDGYVFACHECKTRRKLKPVDMLAFFPLEDLRQATEREAYFFTMLPVKRLNELTSKLTESRRALRSLCSA